MIEEIYAAFEVADWHGFRAKLKKDRMRIIFKDDAGKFIVDPGPEDKIVSFTLQAWARDIEWEDEGSFLYEGPESIRDAIEKGKAHRDTYFQGKLSELEKTLLQMPGNMKGLNFTERGMVRLDEVKTFLMEKLPTVENVDSITRFDILDCFMKRMKYLDEYGGDRYRVELHSDWAPLSFSLYWQPTKGGSGFNGGLIWEGGGNETFTVSLQPQWWGIHT